MDDNANNTVQIYIDWQYIIAICRDKFAHRCLDWTWLYHKDWLNLLLFNYKHKTTQQMNLF